MVTEYSTTQAQLEAFRQQVRDAWLNAIQEDAPRIPGEEQCRWCRASGTCAAQAEIVLAEFEEFSPAEDLDNERIAEILPRLKHIRNWIDTIQARALNELLEGNDVPGYKVVEGRKGHRRWDDEKAVAGIFKQRFRIRDKDAYTRKFVSPAQAKALLTEARWESIKAHIVQNEGKPTLAPVSDKRPAFVADVADDFDDIE